MAQPERPDEIIVSWPLCDNADGYALYINPYHYEAPETRWQRAWRLFLGRPRRVIYTVGTVIHVDRHGTRIDTDEIVTAS